MNIIGDSQTAGQSVLHKFPTLSKDRKLLQHCWNEREDHSASCSFERSDRVQRIQDFGSKSFVLNDIETTAQISYHSFDLAPPPTISIMAHEVSAPWRLLRCKEELRVCSAQLLHQQWLTVDNNRRSGSLIIQSKSKLHK